MTRLKTVVAVAVLVVCSAATAEAQRTVFSASYVSMTRAANQQVVVEMEGRCNTTVAVRVRLLAKLTGAFGEGLGPVVATVGGNSASSGDGHGHAGAGRTAGSARDRVPVPVAIGACRDCGHRVRSRHRLQSSDAVGAAGVQIGPQPVALAILNKQLGLSFGKVEMLLRQQYGVAVSRSGLVRAVARAGHGLRQQSGELLRLVRAVARAGRRAKPTHDDLLKQLGGSPVVTPDETGWRVGGDPAWLWVGATPKTTVHLIRPAESVWITPATERHPQILAPLVAAIEGRATSSPTLTWPR